jgi:hypothetical protein
LPNGQITSGDPRRVEHEKGYRKMKRILGGGQAVSHAEDGQGNEYVKNGDVT